MPDVFNAADAVLMPALGRGLGDKPALLWRDRAVTYRALFADVCRAANLFANAGLERDGRVVLMVKDCPDYVTAYLGAIKAGGVAIGLNVRATGDDLAFVLADSGARFLVLDRAFRPAWEAAREKVAHPVAVIETDGAVSGPTEWRDRLAAEEPFAEAVARDPADMAFWIYTSGTTGTPKGAVHRQADVLPADAYSGQVLGIGEADVVFATSKLFFAYALGTCLFGAFQLGATTVLMDDWPESRAVADVMRRHRPTVVFSVPTMYRNLLADGTAEREEAFRAVRHYVSAGERLPAALWEKWKAATGVEIIDGMGTSETIYMLLTNRPGRVRPGASGTAAPECEVRLADLEGRPVAPGEAGILWAKIPSRCAGYWNQPEKSADVFRGEWFRTGDMYTVDADGYWHHQGRADDMLKISGQWVSPAEIEEVAVAHTRVADAAAVATETADGLVRTTLFCVAPEGADPAALESEVRAALAERLAPYKSPKWVRFIDAIPRTATGKVQRFRLREMAAPAEAG